MKIKNLQTNRKDTMTDWGAMMSKEIFFGLTRKSGIHPLDSMYGASEPEYSLYLINNSSTHITLINKASGGFKTYDSDIVVTGNSQDEAVSIVIEPQGYILYTELYEDTFNGNAGITQYDACIEVDGKAKVFTVIFNRGAGLLVTMLPCVGKYGRVVRPQISDVKTV